MTSQDRREARYQRRQLKRQQKKEEIGGLTFEEVFSFENLCKAGKECCKAARWKTSVKKFERNLLLEVSKIYDELYSSTRHFDGFHSFTTIEHGKTRNIDALRIQDKTIQKCLCKNLLVPVYSRSLIYDNGASLRDKGMHFQLARYKKHLQDHYRKYGLKGGIYQFDFKSYFASLPHDKLKERARQKISDDRVYDLLCTFIDEFQYMRFAEPGKGVGLGSEISQILALDYVNPIDHYIKDVCGIHGYGRYMDDGYVISDSIEQLKEIDKAVHELTAALGIKLNDKKCRITPFKHHSFTFLKMKTTLTNSGKVIMKLNKKSVKAMRRKLNIFYKWVTAGRFSLDDVYCSYQSWRSYAAYSHSYKIVRSLDKKYKNLFKGGRAIA